MLWVVLLKILLILLFLWYDLCMELAGIEPAVVKMVLSATCGKGGRVCNPRKGFGSSGKAREAARIRWERYRRELRFGKRV